MCAQRSLKTIATAQYPPGVVFHAYNLSAQEDTAGLPRVQGFPGLHNETLSPLKQITIKKDINL